MREDQILQNPVINTFGFGRRFFSPNPAILSQDLLRFINTLIHRSPTFHRSNAGIVGFQLGKLMIGWKHGYSAA